MWKHEFEDFECIMVKACLRAPPPVRSHDPITPPNLEAVSLPSTYHHDDRCDNSRGSKFTG